MARYYPGDHDDTVVPPLALGEGRDNADNETKDTDVTLNADIEGANKGETVKVGSKRATWLIANGYATRPQDYVDQYANSRRPANPPAEPEPEPEPAPGEGEGAA